MKLTAIKRAYLFNRVCYKIKIPQKYVFPLYTIYLLQPVGFIAIDTVLKRTKHNNSGAQMLAFMKYLKDNDLVSQDSNKKYTLTPAGLSILKDIENRLRKERHDK